MGLIEFTNRGLFCPPGNFYIDPWRKVDKAVITHAHGDHARHGSKSYLAHNDSVPVLRLRLGINNHYEGLGYGEPVNINGVQVSFHPAGHIIGSAQVRVEYTGEVWVVSGDYKTEDDGLCTPFEPVKCHAFITESTFGLPIYKWRPQKEIFNDMNNWWRQNAAQGKASVLLGYSLGKTQRMLYHLDQNIGPIYLHGSIHEVNRVMIDNGIPMPDVPELVFSKKKVDYKGAMIIAPPGSGAAAYLRMLGNYSAGMASGWMQLRGKKRWGAADKGFVLSDHADWPGLNAAIKATSAERVYVTHGYTQVFSKWLREQGYDSQPVNTLFGEEEG